MHSRGFTELLVLLTTLTSLIFAINLTPHSYDWEKQLESFLYEATIIDVEEDHNDYPVQKNEVEFFLFDNGNRHQPIVLTDQNLQWIDGDVDKLFVIIHGWLESKNQAWIINLRNAILDKYPKSYVVEVDYSGPAFEYYRRSVVSAKYVGHIIGEMLIDINKHRGFSTKKMILLSFSLGCHVAGFAGKKVEDFLPKISRIIAMDPAKIFWENKPCRKRLCKTDADVVVALHTDSETLGYADPLGTIDFYANGGFGQNGCKNTTFEEPWNTACSHSRSYEYVIEALKYPGSFNAKKCANWTTYKAEGDCGVTTVSLGDFDTKEEGVFYFATHGKAPFSMDYIDDKSSATSLSTGLSVLTPMFLLIATIY